MRRVARAPAQPIERYFNRRFQDVHGHLDNETDAVNARLEGAVATTRALQERVATDVEVVSELTLGLERFVERFDDRMDALLSALERLLGHDAHALSRLQEHTIAGEPGDAAFSFAASHEHEPAEIADLLERLRGWLRRDAELVLSLPASMATDELLRGWDVRERRVLVRRAANQWEPAATAESADHPEAVAVLRLTPSA
jgi:hypothetical protein